MLHRVAIEGRARAFAAAFLGSVLIAGCATAPRATGHYPVEIQLDSKTVAALPGVLPELVTYSDGRVELALNPAQQWGVPRMATQELQAMVDHCSGPGGGEAVLRLRRAVVEAPDRSVLGVLADGADLPLAGLAEFSGRGIDARTAPAGSRLRLTIDPGEFRGRLREEVQAVFHDAAGQVAPGVDAWVESMTTTPQEVAVGRRTARVHYLYVRLQNRSDTPYLINGMDTGAMEVAASRMLTAASADGATLRPGGSLIVRLPIEFSRTDLVPGWQTRVDLATYLDGAGGVVGPEVVASIPVRIQIEMKSAERGATMQRGFLTPTVQVQKLYHVERAGCFAER